MRLNSANLALVKYWLTADLLRTHFFRRFAECNSTHLAEAHGQLGLAYYWVSDPGVLSSLWISALYVVIEGYRDLKLSKPEIDSLLRSNFVDDVRLYRNATFHFQADSFHEKYLPVLKSFEAKQWLDDVHRKLGAMFADALGLTSSDGVANADAIRLAVARQLAGDA